MAKKPALKIKGASIRTVPGPEAAGAAASQPRLLAAIEVENPGTTPLHVWSSVRGYDYDPDTRKLTLYLTGRTPALPSGIEMISNHPRTPHQVVVGPGGTATVEARIPRVIRRRVPGGGLGMSFVESRIDLVEQLEAHVQVSPTPVKIEPGENPEASRVRLAEQGETVSSTIRLTGNTGYKER